MSENNFPIDQFTDLQVWETYKLAKMCIGDPEPKLDESKICKQSRDGIEPLVAVTKDKADQARYEALESKKQFLVAACHYLVLAQSKKTVDCQTPAKLFHFAANAFRDYGLLQNASMCYFNSALECYNDHRDSQYKNDDDSTKKNNKEAIIFGKRSAGRAKTLFHQLGLDEESTKSHVLQQRLYQLELSYQEEFRIKRILYWLWDTISNFGTSPKRWIISTIIVFVFFATLYPILIDCGQLVVSQTGCIEIQRSGFALFSSSILFSIGNLFQFGMLSILIPIRFWGQVFVTLHGICAFILLGTGATFLTRN